MSKRVSYQNLLKEAIAEFDTSKTVDVKGPMLDPILKWDGQGELPTQKDAASILERYYFNEKQDKGVEINESENEDGTEGVTASQKHAEGEGTEQAGTGDNVAGAKKDAEKEIAKEADEMEDEKEEKEEVEESETVTEKEEKEEEMEESENMTEDLENSVIEKLISEMEEEDEEDEEDEEEIEEADTMKHTTGAGTEQAGTGDADKEVPDRKDKADSFVKPKDTFNEQDEMEDEEDEEDLDVDKQVKEAAAPSAVPGGPSPKKGGEDVEEDVYEEAFRLFEEEIENDEEAEKDED